MFEGGREPPQMALLLALGCQCAGARVPPLHGEGLFTVASPLPRTLPISTGFWRVAWAGAPLHGGVFPGFTFLLLCK